MKISAGTIIPVVLAVVFGFFISRQANANNGLKLEQKHLQAEAAEASRLKAEQAKLQSLSEVDQAELQKARAESEKLRKQIELMRRAMAGSIAVSQAPQKTEWLNKGRSSPADTIQSVIWAGLSGDVEALMPMLAYDAEARAQADEFFSSLPQSTRIQYGSADKVIATMIASRIPLYLTSAEFMKQTVESDGCVEAEILLRAGSVTKPRKFHLQPGSAGWQLLVPKTVILSLQHSLQSK